MQLDAPNVATKICVCAVISPVAASIREMVWPAQSTNSFSPAMCLWRMDRFNASAHARYFTHKLVYL